MTRRAHTVRVSATARLIAGFTAACAIGACTARGLLRVPDGSSSFPMSTSIAGEWVDVRKSTPSDSMVWVLTADGDDQLLAIVRDATGLRHETRRHYGRWTETRRPDSLGTALRFVCFVRRPGRDASSCSRFAIETMRDGVVTIRRLTVFGYVGEHHTSDRVLLERLATPNAEVAAPNAAADRTSPTPAPASAGAGGGFHPRAVQPERPSVATHAGTVAPGYLEIETGIERDQIAGTHVATSIPTLIKVGVSSHLQVAFGLPASTDPSTPFGAGDASIGIKWRVFEDHPIIQDVAILPTVKFNSGGARGSGTTDISLLLINSRTFGPVGVDLNLGTTWHSGDGSLVAKTSTMWTVAAGIPIRGDFGWALELYGYPGTGGAAGAAPLVAVLTGPTFVLRPELALDAGIIRPVFSNSQRPAYYIGLVTSLGRLPHP